MLERYRTQAAVTEPAPFSRKQPVGKVLASAGGTCQETCNPLLPLCLGQKHSFSCCKVGTSPIAAKHGDGKD